MFNITDSIDHLARATVAVSHRVSADDVIYVVAHEILGNYSSFEVMKEQAMALTKKDVERMVRDRLYFDGCERLWTVTEEHDGELAVAAAYDAVGKLWPDWRPTGEMSNRYVDTVIAHRYSR